MSRSRLPLPPVPAAATRTPAAPAAGTSTPASVLPRPARTWPDDAEPASTGPAGLRAPAPRVPRQATSSGASAPVHGDWTTPPRGSASRELPSEEEMRAFLSGAAPAPETTAIPERSVSGRGRTAEPPLDGEELPVARAGSRPSRAPVGGRAALRAERQAAEAARKKSGKRPGAPALLDEAETPRKPRRVLVGLIAMVVVALGVLGVYQLTSPGTDEAAATTPTTSAPTAPLEPLPALPSETAPVEEVVTTPIRVPVVVLNATDVNGLAARISGAVVGAGWESPAVGAYAGGDIAATTVYFTEGDENQRQAALQLVDQFPQLQGPAPRFFEMPAEVTTPGLVVVAAGDWQP